ncbi:galactosylgalactosylxylosylprotein 3-beta-glucuronosyltransferase 1 isoform X1 [Anolis carolinensis]|uniref:Galactosylgalactosylxylosylprotein 3-beta-glucuronosyltransferase n=2 Tax=Anolis carolinensis TaxID=28377 RepID=G1KCZ6_ANOCA|nr:PREDICTED: galactosylgalactosylxylosylprotein 3-beta-glucuronosyltransferase 1 [Anolis carolinensis]XP_008106097.1 PREDICTED: galactosylgalactosylxylosylprotein 3-beta-glucuronosyltransferase 1 [Anolis carolinensis]XP_016848088.1 PREDICTED: galactosylgalactosylxylosylprotein 3-beta-glucuronosyltransferase 1 [Anolis carolinensis]XP_016848089.1 PREDICTED: galactosylgalactosylxylosylprotein 3-beta-glucuronosyltransferase 1 [Anolis carolinensis]XP_016848090.1 PREDICTED: galactosylgalactosylxylos|eukprot:XP_003219195.1 PREDICTED: galactosylgalactosylxylosylprotein 3-beta-glucuronosyltransferase 1 [Anolis carolinensis]
MLRRRNLLTTLLIALPWGLLLTLWHQYPTTRYLSLLRKETDENVTAKSLFNSTSLAREDGLPSCARQPAIGTAPKIIRSFVYSRPPPWSDTLPAIFVITPTYTRPVQKAELTRLANTFLHVQNLHWIVVEDSPRRTNLVSNLLEKAGINFTHLNIETPKSLKVGVSWIPSHTPRGTFQRNLGLHWLRQSFSTISPPEGVVYFADDDNTYSLELFEEMRYTKKVSVWPVAFVGGLRYESPKVSPAGKVVGWTTVFDPNRPFAIDMAGFAVNIRLILEKSQANFKLDGVKGGYQETSLLKDLVTMDGLEPKAANCTKVLVWHTRTERPTLVNEGKHGFTDLRVEV